MAIMFERAPLVPSAAKETSILAWEQRLFDSDWHTPSTSYLPPPHWTTMVDAKVHCFWPRSSPPDGYTKLKE